MIETEIASMPLVKRALRAGVGMKEVAMAYRHQKVDDAIEDVIRRKGQGVEGSSGESLLLMIVAPPREVRELSEQEAERLLEGLPDLPELTEDVKTCRNGHPKTPGDVSYTSGYARCLVCRRQQQKGQHLKRDKAKKAANARKWYQQNRERHLAAVGKAKFEKNEEKWSKRPKLTQEQWKWAKQFACGGGHERTKENTFIDARGSRRCLDCYRRARKLGAAS